MALTTYTMELMDAGEGPLAWYYDWTGELNGEGEEGGLCLLCPSCGAERELTGQAHLASRYDCDGYGSCDVCGA